MDFEYRNFRLPLSLAIGLGAVASCAAPASAAAKYYEISVRHADAGKNRASMFHCSRENFDAARKKGAEVPLLLEKDRKAKSALRFDGGSAKLVWRVEDGDPAGMKEEVLRECSSGKDASCFKKTEAEDIAAPAPASEPAKAASAPRSSGWIEEKVDGRTFYFEKAAEEKAEKGKSGTFPIYERPSTSSAKAGEGCWKKGGLYFKGKDGKSLAGQRRSRELEASEVQALLGEGSSAAGAAANPAGSAPPDVPGVGVSNAVGNQRESEDPVMGLARSFQGNEGDVAARLYGYMTAPHGGISFVANAKMLEKDKIQDLAAVEAWVKGAAPGAAVLFQWIGADQSHPWLVGKVPPVNAKNEAELASVLLARGFSGKNVLGGGIEHNKWIKDFLATAADEAQNLHKAYLKDKKKTIGEANMNRDSSEVPVAGQGGEKSAAGKIPPFKPGDRFGVEQLFGKWGDRNVFHINGRRIAVVIISKRASPYNFSQMTDWIGIYDISEPYKPAGIFGKRFKLDYKSDEKFSLDDSNPEAKQYTLKFNKGPEAIEIDLQPVGKKDGGIQTKDGESSTIGLTVADLYNHRVEKVKSLNTTVKIGDPGREKTFYVSAQSSNEGSLLFWDKDMVENPLNFTPENLKPAMEAPVVKMAGGGLANISGEVYLGQVESGDNADWYHLRFTNDANGSWAVVKGKAPPKDTKLPDGAEEGSAASGSPGKGEGWPDLSGSSRNGVRAKEVNDALSKFSGYGDKFAFYENTGKKGQPLMLLYKVGNGKDAQIGLESEEFKGEEYEEEIIKFPNDEPILRVKSSEGMYFVSMKEVDNHFKIEGNIDYGKINPIPEEIKLGSFSNYLAAKKEKNGFPYGHFQLRSKNPFVWNTGLASEGYSPEDAKTILDNLDKAMTAKEKYPNFVLKGWHKEQLGEENIRAYLSFQKPKLAPNGEGVDAVVWDVFPNFGEAEIVSGDARPGATSGFSSDVKSPAMMDYHEAEGLPKAPKYKRDGAGDVDLKLVKESKDKDAALYTGAIDGRVNYFMLFKIKVKRQDGGEKFIQPANPVLVYQHEGLESVGQFDMGSVEIREPGKRRGMLEAYSEAKKDGVAKGIKEWWNQGVQNYLGDDGGVLAPWSDHGDFRVPKSLISETGFKTKGAWGVFSGPEGKESHCQGVFAWWGMTKEEALSECRK